eukprot:c9911_g1_i1 orf=161-1048(+)
MDNDGSPNREASPDWLRTFQTPLKDFQTLSSSSPSTSSHGPSSKERSKSRASKAVDLDSDSDQSGGEKAFSTRANSNKGANLLFVEKEGSKHVHHQSTDERDEEAELQDHKDEGSLQVEGVALPEEDAGEGQERRTKRAVSTLPLVFGDKIHRSKVLLECEGDALDVSGDVGAVGRLSVSASHDDDFLLDLKGVIYKGTIVPSNTFFVVNIGQSEAKVEAIMNDFVQLQPSANVFEAETMVEGTLEGFGFDSDEDRDYTPVATGMTNTPKIGDDSKDEKKKGKQKAKPNKPSKGL